MIYLQRGGGAMGNREGGGGGKTTDYITQLQNGHNVTEPRLTK